MSQPVSLVQVPTVRGGVIVAYEIDRAVTADDTPDLYLTGAHETVTGNPIPLETFTIAELETMREAAADDAEYGQYVRPMGVPRGD